MSYFDNRIIQVSTPNLVIIKRFNWGCPQGSCSGPGLWCILLDDLLNINLPDNTEIQAYADDILVLISHKSRDQLERYANTVIKEIDYWAKRVKQKINYDKCQAIILSKGKILKRRLGICIWHNRIKNVDYLKYLGILWNFDRKLNWNEHIDYIAQKASVLMKTLTAIAANQWVWTWQSLKSFTKEQLSWLSLMFSSFGRCIE